MRLDTNAPIITTVAMSAIKSQVLIIEPKTTMVAAVEDVDNNNAGKCIGFAIYVLIVEVIFTFFNLFLVILCIITNIMLVTILT